MKVSRRLMILNRHGMYARPSGSFAKICLNMGPNTTVTVRKDEQESDGKSIMGCYRCKLTRGRQ